VRAAEALRVSRGINGVPAVVVEGKGRIAGGPPAGAPEGALRGMAGAGVNSSSLLYRKVEMLNDKLP
jgi:hypothetical protein